MDQKIHLLYCRMAVFRILIGNYLEEGEAHPRMLEVEVLLAELEMTLADISEVFMSCDTKEERTNATMNEDTVD
ncbi:hypothetical protein ZIOFF_011777 [Zingiber officinale]|uniref:AAA+ ATPase At3g28540-like C-terminal domain-containing protein n=1 Tax=Zingiber officinale TaxID=94328 RepID=A0A8J5HJQ3_ZINOF|nr:hypothetical protein ZIOFF_011777 [Zingiber officinale]